MGTGAPIEPAVGDDIRTHDLAMVTKKRWAIWADQVAAEIEAASVLCVTTGSPVYSLGPELAEVKILMWPSRIQGISRIAREARTFGTVPVVLAPNRFATGADHCEGVVLAADLDEMTSTIAALLDDLIRLASLSVAAKRSALEQTNWPALVDSAAAAVATVSSDPAPENHELRRFPGDRLRKMIDAEIAGARRERPWA